MMWKLYKHNDICWKTLFRQGTEYILKMDTSIEAHSTKQRDNIYFRDL